MSGSRHDVDSRDPSSLCLLEASVTDVYRVEDAHVWMQWAALISTVWATDMAVRVDEPRHDGTTTGVMPFRIVRNRRAVCGANGNDLPFVNDQDSVRQLGSFDRNQSGPDECLRHLLCIDA